MTRLQLIGVQLALCGLFPVAWILDGIGQPKAAEALVGSLSRAEERLRIRAVWQRQHQ